MTCPYLTAASTQHNRTCRHISATGGGPGMRRSAHIQLTGPIIGSSFSQVRESLPGERMKLQEKLERMTMTAFERRLLKQWLAANETLTEGEPEPADEESDSAEVLRKGSDPIRNTIRNTGDG